MIPNTVLDEKTKIALTAPINLVAKTKNKTLPPIPAMPTSDNNEKPDMSNANGALRININAIHVQAPDKDIT